MQAAGGGESDVGTGDAGRGAGGEAVVGDVEAGSSDGRGIQAAGFGEPDAGARGLERMYVCLYVLMYV